MSNEVKIVVTSDDRSNLGAIERRFSTAGKRAGKSYDSGFQRETSDTGGRAGRRIGSDAADALNDAIGKTHAGEILGREFEHGGARARESVGSVADSVKNLDKRIESIKKRTHELGVEFARTGSADALQSLRDIKKVENDLVFVRRHIKDIGDESEKSGNRLTRALKVAGKKGAEAFGVAMSGGKIYAIAAAGVLAASFVGAVNAAIMAGAGVGAMGLGALLLKEEPAVVSAAWRMMRGVKAAFSEAAQPLVGPFVEALDKIRVRSAGLGTYLKTAFSNAAPQVNQLVDAVFRLAESAMPGFNRAIARSGPVMAALGESSEILGEGLSRMFDILSSDPQASADALTALARAIATVGEAAAWMLKGLQTATKPVTGMIDGMKGAWRGLLEDLASGDDAMAKVAQGALKQYDAIDQSNDAMRRASAQAQAMAEAENALAAKTGELANELLAMSGSAIAVEAAFDNARTAIKDNGRTLDINTEKGRNNRTAIDAIATAALKQQEAMVAAGASTGAMSVKLGRAYTQFVKAARGAGMSKVAADRLARSYGLLPHRKSTSVKAPGAIQSKAQVDALRRSIAGLKSKSVRMTISTVYKTYGQASALAAQRYRAAGLATGGVLGRAASGGPRGLVEVGEQGPEALDVRSGTVYPSSNARMRAQARGAEGGREPIMIELRSSGRDVDDLLVRILQRAIHVRGGNVQVALGRG